MLFVALSAIRNQLWLTELILSHPRKRQFVSGESENAPLYEIVGKTQTWRHRKRKRNDLIKGQINTLIKV
jgi:hypothetical protein